MKKGLLALFLFNSIFVFASGEHAEKEFITGSGFDLVHTNSILVGTYENKPIWAEKKCGSHIKGIVKVEEKILDVSVELIDRSVIGTFKDKQIKFIGINKETQQIKLTLSTDEIIIKYENQDFDPSDGHFKGINFKFTNNNTEYSIFLDGESCLGSMIFYSIFFYGLTTL